MTPGVWNEPRDSLKGNQGGGVIPSFPAEHQQVVEIQTQGITEVRLVRRQPHPSDSLHSSKSWAKWVPRHGWVSMSNTEPEVMLI